MLKAILVVCHSCLGDARKPVPHLAARQTCGRGAAEILDNPLTATELSDALLAPQAVASENSVPLTRAQQRIRWRRRIDGFEPPRINVGVRRQLR